MSVDQSGDIVEQPLAPYTEGDRRTDTHAKACKPRSTWGSCEMSCRCWCHGITKHLNGDLRADAPQTGSIVPPTEES